MSRKISDNEFEFYQGLSAELSALRHEMRKIEKKNEQLGLMVLGAARQGFVNEKQRQALYFALENLTGEPYIVLKLIIDVPPKEFKKSNDST